MTNTILDCPKMQDYLGVIDNMAKKSLVYFQSGGPTTVINSSLLGVVQEAKRHSEIDGIYGAMYGVEGLIEDNLIDLRDEDENDLSLLKHTPGAILGSTRRKMPGIADPLFDEIIGTIQKHNIGYVLVNGGNDSMDTCHRLSQFFVAKDLPVQVLGIPKTIDNDLELTDHGRLGGAGQSGCDLWHDDQS